MDEVPTFLGQPAATWSAVAALGSLLTAVVLAVLNMRLSGPRPKVIARLAAISSDMALHTMKPFWFSQRGKFPAEALECVEVTIENRGRSPLTIDHPVFELRLRAYRPLQWWRTISHRVNTIGTKAITWPNYETEPGHVLQAGTRVRYLLQVGPLFEAVRQTSDSRDRRWLTPKRLHKWDYVRVRVGAVGVRERVLRWHPLPMAPGRQQFNGRPETFRQVVSRWCILDSLVMSDFGKLPRSHLLDLSNIPGVVETLTDLYDAGTPLTYSSVREALDVYGEGLSVRVAREIGRSLIRRGYAHADSYWER